MEGFDNGGHWTDDQWDESKADQDGHQVQDGVPRDARERTILVGRVRRGSRGRDCGRLLGLQSLETSSKRFQGEISIVNNRHSSSESGQDRANPS